MVSAFILQTYNSGHTKAANVSNQNDSYVTCAYKLEVFLFLCLRVKQNKLYIRQSQLVEREHL